jgi:glycerol-3-phosphate O-acyltransferase
MMISGMRVYTGNVLWNDSQELISLFGFFGFFRNMIAHVLVLERVMATFYVKNYERSRNPYFSIIWFAIIVCF